MHPGLTLTLDLNELKELAVLKIAGRLFHYFGAATEKCPVPVRTGERFKDS